MKGCIFPYDLLRLICFKYTDPKTCYNMILTCKRLYYEKYKYYFERRWLMIGLYPSINVYKCFRYEFCVECGLYVNKIKHVCRGKKHKVVYCIWCFQIIGRKTHTCKISSSRCEECGCIVNRDIIKYHTCPFELIKCYNDICGKHRRVLYQNCKYCDFRIDLFICPNDTPRCSKHMFWLS